jgi:hypothetical protein
VITTRFLSVPIAADRLAGPKPDALAAGVPNETMDAPGIFKVKVNVSPLFNCWIEFGLAFRIVNRALELTPV